MEITKILTDEYDICIIFKHENGYWNWIFSKTYWNDYWFKRNKTEKDITKTFVNMFINDPINDTIGVSNGAFHSLQDCMNDFLIKEV